MEREFLPHKEPLSCWNNSLFTVCRQSFQLASAEHIVHYNIVASFENMT